MRSRIGKVWSLIKPEIAKLFHATYKQAWNFSRTSIEWPKFDLWLNLRLSNLSIPVAMELLQNECHVLGGPENKQNFFIITCIWFFYKATLTPLIYFPFNSINLSNRWFNCWKHCSNASICITASSCLFFLHLFHVLKRMPVLCLSSTVETKIVARSKIRWVRGVG